jgi:hypothetical protein
MNDEEMNVVDCMAQYGGSFVKQLAMLFRLADRQNLLRLKVAFQDYWSTYDEMSKEK